MRLHFPRTRSSDPALRSLVLLLRVPTPGSRALRDLCFHRSESTTKFTPPGRRCPADLFGPGRFVFVPGVLADPLAADSAGARARRELTAPSAVGFGAGCALPGCWRPGCRRKTQVSAKYGEDGVRSRFGSRSCRATDAHAAEGQRALGSPGVLRGDGRGLFVFLE